MKATEQDATQWQTLAELGTATIHEAIGNVGAIDPAIRAIRPGMHIVGLARTVELPGGDNLMLHVALSQPLSGRVLVVNAQACLTAGPWGEVMTTRHWQPAAAALSLMEPSATRPGSQSLIFRFSHVGSASREPPRPSPAR